eukprot:2567546-Rhodomonas_salina.3
MSGTELWSTFFSSLRVLRFVLIGATREKGIDCFNLEVIAGLQSNNAHWSSTSTRHSNFQDQSHAFNFLVQIVPQSKPFRFDFAGVPGVPGYNSVVRVLKVAHDVSTRAQHPSTSGTRVPGVPGVPGYPGTPGCRSLGHTNSELVYRKSLIRADK